MRKLIFAMLFVSSAARAAVPSQVSVQGVLRDGSGMLQSTMVSVSVTFYDAATNGTKLAGPFGPTQVMATDGLFTFPISDASLSSLAGASSVWMEVTVGSDIFSRQPITPQLSALACGVADAVKGLTITPTGSIGIGTKNPIGQFHIVSDTGGRQNIETFNPSPAPASALVLTRARGTAASPATTVNGDSVFRIQGFAHNGTAMKQVAAIEANVAGVPDSGANVVPGALHFYTSDASASALRMSITPSGNVGVGTATPTDPLTIAAPSAGTLVMGPFSNGAFIGTRGATGAADVLRLGTGYLERMRIDAAGNVGINNAAPNALLTVNGSLPGSAHSSILTTNAGSLGNTAGDEMALASFGFTSGNASTLGVRALRTSSGSDWTTTAIGLGMDVDNTVRAGANLWLTANGRVGIGTTTPDQMLSVNGDASKAGGGSWTVYSDERLKDIKGAFTAGLDAIRKLQPIRYEYKKDNALGIASNGEHIGFSAQAVQKVIPEAVTTNAKGYLMVNSDPILWTMLNAVKEQQREIESLRARLTQLEGKRTAQR